MPISNTVHNGFDILLLNSYHEAMDRDNLKPYFKIYWNAAQKHVSVKINNQIVEFKSNQLAFYPPDELLEILDNEMNIYVFVFTEAFYVRSYFDALLLYNDLFVVEKSFNKCIQPIASPNEFEKLILNRLEKYKVLGEQSYLMVAHNCIEIILLDAIRWNESDNQIVKNFVTLNNSNSRLYYQFRSLLNQHFKEEKSVEFYSKKLYVTSRKLNQVVEAIEGKKCKKVIIDKVIQEAQYLINDKDLSISEIGQKLGFTEESNFSAFFKKHMKINPKSYREVSSANGEY